MLSVCKRRGVTATRIGGCARPVRNPHDHDQHKSSGYRSARPRDARHVGIHTWLTNTKNTPIEALERAFPMRVLRLPGRWFALVGTLVGTLDGHDSGGVVESSDSRLSTLSSRRCSPHCGGIDLRVPDGRNGVAPRRRPLLPQRVHRRQRDEGSDPRDGFWLRDASCGSAVSPGCGRASVVDRRVQDLGAHEPGAIGSGEACELRGLGPTPFDRVDHLARDLTRFVLRQLVEVARFDERRQP